jgi:DNA (cytosine-5)-methyltransferase 1
MLKVLECFGGIGACSKALERLDIEYEIADYVEIDKYAVKSFNAIHGTNFEPQDICKWDKNIDVDLIMHGSPCQDFSLSGKGAGGDKGSGTRSSLMYETIRIVEKLKPKYVIWENVKNLLSQRHIHNFNAYIDKMKQLGYTSYYQLLNAKNYGIPQNRERVFTISIRNDIDKVFIFPEKQPLKLKLKDLLENNVDEKYYLSEKMIKTISAVGTKNFKNNDSKINLDIARPLTSTMSKMHRAGADNYICDELPNNFDLSIKIKNAIKKGYLEATDGDGCYISNIDRKRGTVQKGKIPTLKTSPDIGVVVKQ